MTALRRGDEHIQFDGMPTGYLLGDFWRWSSSDLLNNTLRGTYCEFIVGAALGLDLSGGRVNWDPWDLTYQREGQEIHIEVKSSAYLQPYHQSRLSDIIFSIRPTRTWDPAGGYSDEVRRQSDVYVFCVYTETDRAKADPLVLDGWDFYIVPTKNLDEVCGGQKTISLPSLLKLDPIRADYSGIEYAIIHCIQSYPPPPVILHNLCILFLCINTKRLHLSRASFPVLLIFIIGRNEGD